MRTEQDLIRFDFLRMLAAFLIAVALCYANASPSRADDSSDSVAAATTTSATPDPSAQPPAGIIPTKATLAQVLASYDASTGTLSKGITTSREVDAISAYGESGTYTEIDSGDDYIETTQLGPTTTSSGAYHGREWRQNENGYTRVVSGIHEEEERSDAALTRAIKGENLGTVRLLGEIESPERAYIVEVNPSAGRHEWLFIDASTG
ncbi:MAG TPA: hypothetical protein VEV38_02450, partial [Candidatus Eremiobacteraceae bacterium]|nr:hypothetical protein [Candidatus Eremiobacteraceae bacterium]